MTNPIGDQFIGEVINFNDDRIRKFKSVTDVCMWFEEIKFGSTYDSTFLDACCVPFKTPEPKDD